MQLEDIGNKIIKIKIKADKVIIETQTNKIKISKATFDSIGFDVGDDLTISMLKTLKNVEQKNEIIRYATNLLISRPYSEKELIKKINKKFDNPRQIKTVVNELKKSDLINDKEFLENYVEYFNKNYFGKYFIINFFRNQGVKDALINSLEFDDTLEKVKARSYLLTIRNKYISSSFARQKQKMYNAMLERGYSVDVILEVLNEIQIDTSVEEKQLIKKYKKAKEKIKDKAQPGVDADSKIVSKLIECGYPLNLIQQVMKLDREGKLND